jgi:hypothetical protein
MIKNNLGFGKVYKRKTIASFTIENKTELYLIANLFNNNLVTINKKISFNKFLLKLNKYFIKGRLVFSTLNVQSLCNDDALYGKSLQIRDVLPTLNDS